MHAHPLEARIDESDHRTASRFDHADLALHAAEQRVAIRFDRIDRRFEGVERRSNWLTGIMVGTWATTLLTILFHR